MNNITIYVGMDVHKERFTLCSLQIGDKDASNIVKVAADYNNILRYFEKLCTLYGRDIKIVCGYEAGCLGFSLYNQLKACGIDCTILAPTTMMTQKGKRIKTDKRDAVVIARCLAYGTYSAVHIPTKEDDEVKEYIRMRDDHKLALKKVKQQILSFCLRHGKHYSGKSHWTIAHMKWLKDLDFKGIYHEILAEYLATYEQLCDKIERFDARIAELASGERYTESVKKLSCLIGIKTTTALATM